MLYSPLFLESKRHFLMYCTVLHLLPFLLHFPHAQHVCERVLEEVTIQKCVVLLSGCEKLGKSRTDL